MSVLPYFTLTCCRASGGLMFTALDFVLAFHWTKHSALNLPKLPLQGRNILRNFRQRGQPREVCPNLKQFRTGNFRSIWLFQPGIFFLIVSISKVQLISGFPETFPVPKVPEFFGSMKSAPYQPVQARALTRIIILCSLLWRCLSLPYPDV